MLPTNKVKMFAIACGSIAVIGVAAAYHVQQLMDIGYIKPILHTVQKNSAGDQEEINYDQLLSPIDSSTTGIPANVPTQFINDNPPVAYVDGITSVAYIVANIKTGKVYFSRKADRVLPVASMSKLITAIAATDTMPATTTITITKSETEVPPDSSNLLTDEKFTLEELLNPMLLNSSNVAAEAVASSSDRQKFLNLMSSYAWEVGMPHAYFADPTGLNPKNHASAREMFALSQYLFNSRPDILAITRTEHMEIATTSDHGRHDVDSTHPFIKDPRFIGGKTGRTLAAGETMMTLLNMENDNKVAFIILGSQYGEREADTLRLIDKYEKLQ